eukprot:CAMPEP_0183717970 /NCGR_PEP_ID=MMETSP0737-20130205/11368_1 /TAXON_ID=385413 /ORGANISM="Thalassiosira miniscula, Strain CCMP1093" /LENGTH=782 /DNA_ID=CAMNT_0025947449 /DNA_START=174 /DNA_END=2522 /DNA_ORIENTATION=+
MVRIRKRKLVGLLVASCCCNSATCSEERLTASADVLGSPASPLHKTERTPKDASASRYDAKNTHTMERVAVAIRSWTRHDGAHNNNKYLEDALRRKSSRRRQQQQQRQRGRNQQPQRGSQENERDLIVGGTAAPPGRFPYAVSLQLEKVLDAPIDGSTSEVSDVHTCGGTLVAMDVVLTAGHCGYEELPSSTSSESISSSSGQGSVDANGNVNFGEMPVQIFYGADVGAYNIDCVSSTSGDGGEPAENECAATMDNMLFEKLVLHPDYTGFHGKGNTQMSLQHDVMLVKLYGASDQPVVKIHNPQLSNEQHEHRDPVEGDELVVIGWGDTDPASGEERTSLASILQAATVSYVPNDICEESKGYSSIHSSPTKFEDYFEYDGTISDDMMCARGSGDVIQDACQGDSGGGLLRLGDDFQGEEDVQMGIVSWGLQCGDEDFPGVYARIGEHYDWIAKKICEMSDSPPTYLNCPPKPNPPGSPYDPVVDLRITIRFDDYRSETGWVLESMPDFRNIVYRGFGHYKSEMSVDENNAVSETVPVHAGRFYMLSMLDEFADGFCCTVGEGYFRVESSIDEYPIVETTPGILWSPHALRRAFYVSPPDQPTPPNYVTIVVNLGIGADPSKFLLVALENVMYESLMLYEIRPFVIEYDSRSGSGTSVYSRTFRVPVFGVEFDRQRYHVLVYDDNDRLSQASFEVYFGDALPENLILAQSGNYGEKNNISRSFVLFKKKIATVAIDSSTTEEGPGDLDFEDSAAATLHRDGRVFQFLMPLLFVVWMGALDR